MSMVLSYKELDKAKTLKTQGWKPDRISLMLFDYTPEDLLKMRTGLGLTRKEAAGILGVRDYTIRGIEYGKANNPIVLQLYGLVLERYYACLKGYIPAYRRIGSDTFKFVEEIGEEDVCS